MASLFGIIIIIVSSVLGVVSVQLSSHELTSQAQELMLSYADETADYVAAKIEKNLTVLNEVAERARTKTMDWTQQQTSLEPDVERLGYLDMAVVTPDGKARYVLSGETADLADRDYIIKALKGEVNISGVLISKVTGEPVIMEAAPITSADGKVAGVLIGRRDGAYLNSITNSVKLGKTGYSFIIGSDGTFYAHPDKDYVLKQINVFQEVKDGGELKAYGLALQKLGMGSRGMTNYELKGDTRLTAMVPVPGTYWMLGIGNHESEILAGVHTLRNTLAIITVVVVLLGILAALIMGSKISKPIRKLKALANRVALGDVDVDTETTLTDEIGELMVAFGEMVGNIKAQAEAGRRIAEGDLSIEVKSRSDKDVLAFSMISIVDTLRNLVSEAEMLTEAAVEGRLETRGDAENFHGAYREIIGGFNATLDAISEPVDVAKDFIVSMAEGAQMDMIPDADSYRGYYGDLI
ncbi:MAG TPA: cache domain-containing protein, partial [Bacillota bacterium]|nr:cache domain-containing protein [Bacillota bacterium]